MGEEEEKAEFDPRIVPVVPASVHNGKDEMNFAEFPLGLVSKRPDPNQKTLEFEDQIVDQKTGERITRKVIITGSDKFGLPTSADDDVLLALIQLSKLQDFESRALYFTRYQLIKLLRWPVNGQSYDRIEQALNRWHGVSLYYRRAWRDRETNTWRNEDFHVLERVTIDLSETERTRPKPIPQQGRFEFASSRIIWNEVVFQSFKSGNIKSLDFSLVMELESAISRRLYRFLDKRLHKIRQAEFDLNTLAFEKIAMSRKTPTGDLKRQIGKALDELAEKGFLEKPPAEGHFRKVKAGQWIVRVERARRSEDVEGVGAVDSAPQLSEQAAILAGELRSFGIEEQKAAELASNSEPQLIREKIDALKSLQSRNSSTASQNPAGFLIRSIERKYKTGRKPTPQVSTPRPSHQSQTQPSTAEGRIDKTRHDQETAIAEFWSRMTPDQRIAAEQDACAHPSNVEVTLRRQGAHGDKLAEAAMRFRYAKARLQEAGKWPK